MTPLESRNLIVHTYNEKTADKIYKEIAPFFKSAEKLLGELKDE